jgi:hypothetical protein
MSAKKSIPVHVRQRVAEEARHRCGYCLRTEELMGMPMTLDHITPEARLTHRYCNWARGNR